MLRLLTQKIPGYITDDPGAPAGNPIFNKFGALFNPHIVSGGAGSTGRLISRILLFAIIAAGLVFFVKLILAGYTYLTSLGEPAKIQSASKELTNAAIGLVVVISAFFIAQIIQVIFGITIL